MQTLDWILFFGFLTYVVFDGVRRSRDNHSAEDHFLAGRHAPWWVLGFSIMATQASAITMIGTTGKGWESGTRFVQFYYALPLAMLILAFTLVPLYYRHRVFTAYEYLGQRFDRKTRILTAALFLIQRGLAAGIVIYAPSVVLAAILGIEEGVTIAVMGAVAVLYTAIGGLRAVLATDVKQMVVM
ncbi:MAG: sodium:solute symporter, partial [Planctomycetota bacterium]